jgi:cytochrome c-type biogenesis protein CcmH
MSWLYAIALALLVFAVACFVLRVPSRMWAVLGACLSLGLAGYSFQAAPNLPGAPADLTHKGPAQGWALVDARRELLAQSERSRSDKVLIADALTRKGQHENAAAMLGSAAQDDPRDMEAWLALGNALVEQAGGRLTPASLVAYRRASVADAKSIAPGYFLGLALIRQGNLMQGRNVWAEVLQDAPQDAYARDIVAERLARLDALLKQLSAAQQQRDK